MEIVWHHHAMEMIRNDEVDTRPRIIPGEREMPVGYYDGVNALVSERVGIGANAEMCQRGILFEFSGEIQWNTAKVVAGGSSFKWPCFVGSSATTVMIPCLGLSGTGPTCSRQASDGTVSTPDRL